MKMTESKRAHSFRAHASCEVFYCDQCKSTFTITEANGQWDAVREELLGTCPDCRTRLSGAAHEEEHQE